MAQSRGSLDEAVALQTESNEQVQAAVSEKERGGQVLLDLSESLKSKGPDS